MIRLNEIFYNDANYSEKAEYCNKNGYMIIEIEPDEIGKRYQIVESTKSQREVIENEYLTLKQWFDVDYARLEQKYRRLYTLKLYCDDGKYPYDKLIDLYNEAEYKRARIQELERLLAYELV